MNAKILADLIEFLTAQLAELDRLRAENAKLHAEIADREKNSIDEHGNMHYWRDRAREAEKETEEREHEIIQLRAELDDPRTVRLPCAVGTTVYAIVHCENIVRDIDDDYETGTGAVECPFESDCPFEDCDDNNIRIVETTVSGVWFDETKIDVFLDKVNDVEIYASDFGKTVFLTREAAEAAKEAQR